MCDFLIELINSIGYELYTIWLTNKCAKKGTCFGLRKKQLLYWMNEYMFGVFRTVLRVYMAIFIYDIVIDDGYESKSD
jgi:hypothetical protein